MSEGNVLPVKKPMAPSVAGAKARKGPEEMACNTEDLIIHEAGGGFLEFQFEEIRLKDYNNEFMDGYDLGLDATLNLDGNDSPVAEPTVMTRFAMDDIMGVLAGTPSVSRSPQKGRALPELEDQPTANFSDKTLDLAGIDLGQYGFGGESRSERERQSRQDEGQDSVPGFAGIDLGASDFDSAFDGGFDLGGDNTAEFLNELDDLDGFEVAEDTMQFPSHPQAGINAALTPFNAGRAGAALAGSKASQARPAVTPGPAVTFGAVSVSEYRDNDRHQYAERDRENLVSDSPPGGRRRVAFTTPAASGVRAPLSARPVRKMTNAEIIQRELRGHQ
ncbi:hypothetical protein KIPB_001741 [Kipferlia bialata]|uniref:Uncharacterized protein n=1 Tax=Kipferlia bialata TaxID=797122 RepID=A0A9K3CR18_9EUKA|nr:hypothetical protein KIPB_001741 [Kipferlia bialata]|eukprot:g1741.t1